MIAVWASSRSLAGRRVQVDGDLGIDESQALKSSSHEAPLALSALTSTRSSGAGSSPGTPGRILVHMAAGPGEKSCRASPATRWRTCSRLPAGALAGDSPGSGGGGAWTGGTAARWSAHPPRGGPRDLPAARRRAGLEQFHAVARARDPGRHGNVADRDGAQYLAGEARDHHVRPGLAAPHRPAEQRARRPAVLGVRVPRPGCVRGRPPLAVTQRYVEAPGTQAMVRAGRRAGMPPSAVVAAARRHRSFWIHS